MPAISWNEIKKRAVEFAFLDDILVLTEIPEGLLLTTYNVQALMVI